MVFMVFSFSMSLCLPLRLSPSVRADPETSALSPLLRLRIALDRWVAVGLVLNHHCRPSGQDCRPHPFRHRRLLATTLILRSCASAVSSPSVLLDPPRSAGGEPPWPDPQRWRGGPGGYPASAPLR